MSKFELPKSKSHDVDPAALEAFAAGAKTKTLGERPWDKFDPKATPKHNVSIRLNDYHLEMLRYLSEAEDRSQQHILRRLVVPRLEEEVKSS